MQPTKKPQARILPISVGACVRKDCNSTTSGEDRSHCIAGLFGGGDGPLPSHFCRSDDKLFRPTVWPAACTVWDNSASVGLVNYPRPLVTSHQTFVATRRRSCRYANCAAYGYRRLNLVQSPTPPHLSLIHI